MKNETNTTPGTFYQLEIITPSDCYGDLYATKAEAYEAAEQTWNHLTRSEKAERAFYLHTYGGALKDGETPEEAFLRLVDDNATETACTETEALYSREGDLMEWGDSISWCTPYEVFTTTGDRVLFCSGPHFCVDGDWTVHDLAQAVQGDDYDPDRGYTDDELIRQEADILSGGCRECPFFSACDAMRETRTPY